MTPTRVIAFDIGTRNLGYCMMSYNGVDVPVIEDWGLINLGINQRTPARGIHKKIKYHILDRFMGDPTMHVIIESQAASRPIMKTVATVIFSQFHMSGFKHVDVISARKKLSRAHVDDIRTYTARKKHAILRTYKTLVACPVNHRWVSDLFNLASKKDDLADAYLTALAYLRKLGADDDPCLQTQC
jgi:hypothetical protein